MWNYRKIDFIRPALTEKYIAFVGSGGKTTLMEYMAGEFLKQGRTVAITTTTKIYVKDPYILLDEVVKGRAAMPFVRVGRNIENGKLTAIGFDDIGMLGSIYDIVLIEADGAKGRPLKYPAPYEPVIPHFSEKIFAVCGLDALFGRLDEDVFRWELFREATGTGGDALITRQLFLRFFADDALLKGVDREKCTVVLNKYDMLGIKSEAMEIGKEIIAGTGVEEVMVSSVLYKVFWGINYRKSAASSQKPEVGSRKSG